MNNILKKNGTYLLLIGLLFFTLAACGKSGATGNGSEEYPNQSIEMVVPASAGGDTDRNARLLATYLEKELGVSIVVQNVVGSGGTIAVDELLSAEPDGYRVLYFHNGILLNNILGLSENKYSDLAIAGISELDEGNGIVVKGDSKYKDIEDLIEAAKEKPQGINVGSLLGSFTHIQLLDIQEKEGIEFNFVDVGDHSDRNAALLGGQVDVIPTQLGLVSDYFKSGDMKPLAVFSEERLEQFPDVPTFKELDIDSTFEKFFFTAFPPETPNEVVDVFSKALEKVSKNEEYIKKAKSYGITPTYIGSEEAEKMMEERQQAYQAIYEKSK